MYVDYTEKPELDENPNKTEEHIYKLLHTGNSQQILSFISTIGGFNSGYEYIIEHNLDTENVVVQCRNTSTKKEVVYDNIVVDENKVKIIPDEVLTADQVTVTILAIK